MKKKLVLILALSICIAGIDLIVVHTSPLLGHGDVEYLMRMELLRWNESRMDEHQIKNSYSMVWIHEPSITYPYFLETIYQERPHVMDREYVKIPYKAGVLLYPFYSMSAYPNKLFSPFGYYDLFSEAEAEIVYNSNLSSLQERWRMNWERNKTATRTWIWSSRDEHILMSAENESIAIKKFQFWVNHLPSARASAFPTPKIDVMSPSFSYKELMCNETLRRSLGKLPLQTLLEEVHEFVEMPFSLFVFDDRSIPYLRRKFNMSREEFLESYAEVWGVELARGSFVESVWSEELPWEGIFYLAYYPHFKRIWVITKSIPEEEIQGGGVEIDGKRYNYEIKYPFIFVEVDASLASGDHQLTLRTPKKSYEIDFRVDNPEIYPLGWRFQEDEVRIMIKTRDQEIFLDNIILGSAQKTERNIKESVGVYEIKDYVINVSKGFWREQTLNLTLQYESQGKRKGYKQKLLGKIIR